MLEENCSNGFVVCNFNAANILSGLIKRIKCILITFNLLIHPKGRTFKSMIQSYLPRNLDLNTTYQTLYDTPEGRQVYDETLANCRANFPQYVRELEGIAKGAEVEFYKVITNFGFKIYLQMFFEIF